MILPGIRDGNYPFKRNLLSRLPKPVKLTHRWIKKHFKFKEPDFYYQFFDESINTPFEVPPGRIYTNDMKNQYLIIQSCMFYRDNKIACVFCLLSYSFYFIGDKMYADCFLDKTTPSLKANDRLKFYQDVAFNRVEEKGNPRCKISYKILKEEYGHDTLLDIYIYPTLIQLKYYLDGFQHCVTVVGKCIFDSNFIFTLLLTKDN